MKETTESHRQWIVLTGYIATEMTNRALASHKEELKERLGRRMIRDCEGLYDTLKTKEAYDVISDFETDYVGELSETGIFGGLWNMAEKLGVGLSTERFSIPIRQEIIEVAEWYDVDPYKTSSKGNLLIVTKYGYELVEALNEAGVTAAVIGHTTDTRDRVVATHERITYLTPTG